MQTNEQKSSEVNALKDKALTPMQETLILKGIASNIQQMQFPRFKNLVEMLREFGLSMIPTINVDSEIQRIGRINRNLDDNKKTEELDFASILNNNHDYYMKTIEFNIEKSKYHNINKTNFHNTCVNGFEKKMQICKNLVDLYDRNHYKEIIDITEGNFMYNKIIDKISYSDNIFCCKLPIFSYLDIAYSVDDITFNDINALFSFIEDKLICIYEFYILKNYKIFVRCRDLDDKITKIWDYNGLRHQTTAYMGTQKDWNQTLFDKIKEVSKKEVESIKSAMTLTNGTVEIMIKASMKFEDLFDDLEYYHHTDGNGILMDKRIKYNIEYINDDSNIILIGNNKLEILNFKEEDFN